MKKILCLFGIIVILTGCSKKVSNDAILSVSKDNKIEVQKFNKYSEFDVRVVYLETKLKDVYYNKDGKKYSLKEYIKTIDDVKEITSLLEDYRSYDDGGSQLFSSKEYDLSILICNKINGTSDIYIGDSNMNYINPMCNSDDAILSVSKDNKIEIQEYNKYSEFDVRVVYLETKLKDVYYNKDGKKYSLKEYIKTIDDVKEITSLLEDYRSYDDGGSQLFSSKEYDLSILICNKINGTSDIYIGDSNMTYSGTMCE